MKKSPELLENMITNIAKMFEEHKKESNESLASINSKLTGLPALTDSVSKLYEWRKDHVDPNLDTLMKWRWMILGAGAVITFIISGIVWLVVQNLQLNLNDKIRASEDRQKEFIEEKLSRYEVPITD